MPLSKHFVEQGIKLISPEEIQAIVKLWIYEGDDINKINELLKETGELSNILAASLLTMKNKKQI